MGAHTANTLVRGISPAGSVSASACAAEGSTGHPRPLKPQKERMVIIEKRTERIKFWLTDKELKQIDRKAEKLGMNRSEYIRHIIANCKLVHTPSIDYESYYNRLKCISDEINHHLIVLNQIGTLDEPQFHTLCEEAVGTSKRLSNELTKKLDIEIEKSREVNA